MRRGNTGVEHHWLTYRDADGVERKMQDPDFPWIARRGALSALARTRQGALDMLDRIEQAKAAR